MSVLTRDPPGKPVQGWTACPEFPCHSHLIVGICGNGLLLSYCIAKGSSLCTTNSFDQFIGRHLCHEQATLQPFDHKCGGRPFAHGPDGDSGWIVVQHWQLRFSQPGPSANGLQPCLACRRTEGRLSLLSSLGHCIPHGRHSLDATLHELPPQPLTRDC